MAEPQAVDMEDTASEAFALTKRQLRLPALDRLDRHGAALDAEVARLWQQPESAERIRAYLERTVGRSG